MSSTMGSGLTRRAKLMIGTGVMGLLLVGGVGAAIASTGAGVEDPGQAVSVSSYAESVRVSATSVSSTNAEPVTQTITVDPHGIKAVRFENTGPDAGKAFSTNAALTIVSVGWDGNEAILVISNTSDTTQTGEVGFK